MGFFNIFHKREAVPSSTGEGQKPSGATVRAKLVHVGADEGALGLSAVLHAIDLRATTAARSKLEYQRWAGDKWVQFVQGSTQARLNNYLFQVRPNMMQNAQQMWRMLYLTCDIYGRAALYLERDMMGNLAAVWPCRCSHLLTTNEYSLTNSVTGDTLVTSAENCVVIKSIATPTRREGVSLLLYAVRTLSLGATAEQFALDTMAKGGTFKGILKQESAMVGMQGWDNISDDEAKKVASSIQDQWDNGADIATDPSAGNLQQVSQSFQDLQVPMIMDRTTEAVARLFNVPLPLMFTSTNAVYKSMDDAWHTFEALAIRPMLEEVEQELNGKLLNEYDFGKIQYKFNSEGVCLDSDKSKAETDKIYVDAGIKTVDEVRAKLGLAPLGKTAPKKGGEE